MKKLILAGLAALLALSLITCESGSGILDDNTPSVQYSTDGNYVTIRLDGGGNDNDNSRALSRPIAQEGYNFLEVVFRDNTTIARASWEKGKAMSISGVPRGAAGAGVNYGVTGGATLSATVGEAVLFVGRKVGDDLALLAVGKIVAIDGADVTTVNANVLPTTRSVTFGLSAFTGNTVLATPSFAGAGIAASTYTIGDTTRTVTGFSLTTSVPTSDVSLTAAYTLGSSSTNFPITQMLPGVIAYDNTAADPGGFTDGFQLTEPLYLLPNGQEITFNTWKPALVTGSIGAAVVYGDPIPAAIPVDITVPAGAEGLTSFYFSVPVVAITAAASSAATPVLPKIWFVRPGINTVNLDDGTPNSIGSCMLITAAMSPLNALTIGYR